MAGEHWTLQLLKAALRAGRDRLLAPALSFARKRLLPRLLGLLAELWQRIRSHRLRSLAALLAVLALGLAGARMVPVLYGRAALAHAAGIAARQSRLKGEEEVLLDLRRQAFALGFTAAALDPGTFRLETGLDDAGPTCTISYAFTQPMTFYGLCRVQVPVAAKVTRAPLEPRPLPTAEELVQ